jgi:hypothetical protein
MPPQAGELGCGFDDGAVSWSSDACSMKAALQGTGPATGLAGGSGEPASTGAEHAHGGSSTAFWAWAAGVAPQACLQSAAGGDARATVESAQAEDAAEGKAYAR